MTKKNHHSPKKERMVLLLFPSISLKKSKAIPVSSIAPINGK